MSAKPIYCKLQNMRENNGGPSKWRDTLCLWVRKLHHIINTSIFFKMNQRFRAIQIKISGCSVEIDTLPLKLIWKSKEPRTMMKKNKVGKP